MIKKMFLETNKILASKRMLNNKIKKASINPKEKIQFANNLKKKDLNYFNQRICKILLKSFH